MTWNEFDLEISAIAAELRDTGDFIEVKYSLPRSSTLTGRLWSELHLTPRGGQNLKYKIKLVEVEDLACANICIELDRPPRPRRLVFDLENLYRALFCQAAGIDQ